ncbi:MAG: hypothetical protein NT090_01875 [Acidobacteria bacterium]|nr:hypothetical protein [Acidobacteriota bacterium]
MLVLVSWVDRNYLNSIGPMDWLSRSFGRYKFLRLTDYGAYHMDSVNAGYASPTALFNRKRQKVVTAGHVSRTALKEFLIELTLVVAFVKCAFRKQFYLHVITRYIFSQRII